MPRCFIALEFPDSVRKQLADFTADLSGARRVPADQIHLTLSFLGTIDDALLTPLCRLLRQIRVAPFVLRFSHTGFFPDHRRPRVFWIAPAPEPHLQNLADLIRSVLVSCGIPQEERPFSPHITLARFRSPPARTAPFPPQHSLEHAIPPVSVREYLLFESILSSKGAIHRVLGRFPLDPG